MCNDKNKYDKDFLLAEYNTLRSEIINLQSAKNGLYMLVFTVTASFFGFAFSSGGIQELFLMLPFMIFPLQTRYQSLSEQITKLGNYIAKHIEPNVNGLMWERTSFQTRASQSKSFKKNNSRLPFFKHTFSIVCVISLITFAIINFDLNKNISFTRLFLFIVSTIVSVFVIINEKRFLSGEKYLHWYKSYKFNQTFKIEP